MSATTLSQPVKTSEGWVLRLLDADGEIVGQSDPFTRLLDAVAYRETQDESGCDVNAGGAPCSCYAVYADGQHIDTVYCDACIEADAEQRVDDRWLQPLIEMGGYRHDG